MKYEQGWYEGCITGVTADGYTVTVLEDGDEQIFASFPDPDVRPVVHQSHQDIEDADSFQGNEVLCRHLLCWLWLLQTVLRHSGGMALTVEEAVGRGGWLDLMCALRVEPNVVYGPATAYAPLAPLPGMGTSNASALEEVARLLLLQQPCGAPENVSSKAADAAGRANTKVIAAAIDCFCGSGIVQKQSARVLLYQSMIPCSRQGEQLRCAVMTHELRSAFQSNHSRLFEPESENPEPDQANDLVVSFSWTGEKLLDLVREVSINRSTKQILVCGQAVEEADFTRILLFILDCVDDVLPACKVLFYFRLWRWRSARVRLQLSRAFWQSGQHVWRVIAC